MKHPVGKEPRKGKKKLSTVLGGQQAETSHLESGDRTSARIWKEGERGNGRILKSCSIRESIKMNQIEPEARGQLGEGSRERSSGSSTRSWERNFKKQKEGD